MNDFLQTALTFPTLVWTVLFALCMGYWVLAGAGLGDSDDLDVGDAVGKHSRFYLGGVPSVVAVTLLVAMTWLSCYFLQLHALPGFPPEQQPTLRWVTLGLALVPGFALAQVWLWPLRKFFAKLTPPEPPPIEGRTGHITSLGKDEYSGVVTIEDGGAGLVFHVKSRPPDKLLRGTPVTLGKYDPADQCYWVTPIP